MKIKCYTNLDVRNEQFPNDLPCVPRIGELIESYTIRKGKNLVLKVVSVTWSKKYNDVWLPVIELHVQDYFDCIYDFEVWYGKLF